MSPKEDSYEIKSLQPKITKRHISSNLVCTRVKDNSEIKYYLEKQQDGHFRAVVMTSEKRSASIQYTVNRLPQIIQTGVKCERKECKEAFSYQAYHNKEKNSKCGDCGKAFNSRSDLIKHQRIHERKKSNEHEKCALIHDSEITKPRSNNIGEKAHKCKECGKAFHSSSQLTKHQRIHIGEKHYTCKECEETFLATSQLHLNQRIHTDEEYHECKECG